MCIVGSAFSLSHFFSEIFINIGWFSKRKTIRAYKNVIRVLFPERSGEKFSMYVSRMCVDCTLPCKEPDDQRHFLFGYSSSSESPVTALGKQRHSQACQHSGRHTHVHIHLNIQWRPQRTRTKNKLLTSFQYVLALRQKFTLPGFRYISIIFRSLFDHVKHNFECAFKGV